MGKRKNRKTNIKKSYGSTLESHVNHSDHQIRYHNKDEVEDLSQYALTSAEQFSDEMIKYWRQRRSLFSLFDGSSFSGELPLLDKESWFSVTPEPIAARIAQRCRCTTILDPFCGVGGNSIQFALTCQNVIAIDIDPIKLKMAKHNAKVYGVEKFITFLQGDWREFAKAWKRNQKDVSLAKDQQQREQDEIRWKGCQKLQFDVIFLSPPWGGVSYRTLPSSAHPTPQKGKEMEIVSEDVDQLNESYYPLSALAPSGGKDLFELAKQITSNICLFIPRTVDLKELTTLIQEEDQRDKESKGQLMIDVEEQWLRGRCKALSCYFGELTNWVEEEEGEEF